MGSTTRSTSHPLRLVGAGLFAAALLVGCSASDDAATSFDADEPTEAPAAELFATDDSGDDSGDLDTAGVDASDASSPPADTEGSAPSSGVGGFDLGAIGREVAVEMRITMRSDDLRATVDGILSAASAGGGGVAASDVDYGTDLRDGRATVVVKVPPRALNTLLTGLDDLGEVVSIGQDAEDVTEQLTDLDVRISNAQQSVDRVRALLADATDLREVIDLESELTRRQTDLERLQASERNLQDRVALATVTIQVLPTTAPIAEVTESDPGLGDGFQTGWDAFVGVLFGIAYGLAVIAPALAVAGLLLVIGWPVLHRRAARRNRPSPPDPAVNVEPSGTTAPDDHDDARDERLSGAGSASPRP